MLHNSSCKLKVNIKRYLSEWWSLNNLFFDVLSLGKLTSNTVIRLQIVPVQPLAKSCSSPTDSPRREKCTSVWRCSAKCSIKTEEVRVWRSSGWMHGSKNGLSPMRERRFFWCRIQSYSVQCSETCFLHLTNPWGAVGSHHAVSGDPVHQSKALVAE